MKAGRRPLVFGTLVALILGLGYLLADVSADDSGVASGSARSSVQGVAQEPVVLVTGEDSPPVTTPMGHLAPFTVTVTGTVTGTSGPVPDVYINANAGATGLPFSKDALTDSSGFYSLTIQTGGRLNLHARPPLDTRLVEVNMEEVAITGSFRHDFVTSAGNLLSLRPADEAGQPLEMVDWQLLALSMLTPPPPGFLPEYHLMWDDVAGRYECIVPPDVYSVWVENPPAGYLPAITVFELRGGDKVVDLVFSQESTDPTISYPPDVSKITVGPPDSLGEALVTGEPGAVVPTGHILLTNLASVHRVDAVSQSDGSFNARIYAPPGSPLYILHGPLEWRTRLPDRSQPYDVYPGTLINVPHTHGAPPGTPFAAAGAVGHVGETATVRPHVTAAWAMTGTLRPSTASGEGTSLSADRYAPGDWLHAEGTLRIYWHAITTTTDVGSISAWGDVALQMLGDQDGVPLAPYNAAFSTRLTASGFPIRDAHTNRDHLDCGFEASGLHLSGDHSIDGSFSVDCQVPHHLPPGTYRPAVGLGFSGVPTGTQTQWPATNGSISYGNYMMTEALLPPIVVADTGQPVAEVRHLWWLMMDENTDGTRGAGAQEDADRVGFFSFIATQGAPYVAPPVDRRTGTPITYSLEPVLPMVTSNVSTNNAQPSPPLVPFSLPGGSLSAIILRPDGTTQDLGSEGFSQSAMRARSTWGGFPLNMGTTRVDHGYQLVAASDRFRVAFDQYGHHTITVTGQVDDLWGNTYPGGGTYDVWVAEPLDMATGVLPGTPFDVGDTFNPALQLYPGVPARVEWVVTEYPDSDPAQAVTHTVTGRANRFGYYDGPGFAFTAPGEYRVDLVGRFLDEAGTMWMGARTWGGIVMTPAAQAQLSAHGRRGTNNVWHIPGAWSVFCRDLATIPGMTPHTYAPYFNGDVLWSRLESIFECSGEALQTGGSVDTFGQLKDTLRQRAERMSPPLDLPGDLAERVSHGEIPLLSSTRSGRPPQVYPWDQDQIGYFYFYSQRPGVRVREDITEDYTFPAGYWRFETLYDDQMGVGILGDLPNDFKFQYIGAVFRDVDTGHNEYLGQGSGWIHLPDEGGLGSRVMPPFAGPGNGGWTTEGGPLLTLKGQDIHLFILPTGTLPGAVLQVGDTFRFAGHIMPTLDSQVAVTVTAPSSTEYHVEGRANPIGYFYDPGDDFPVTEPGLWSVDVHVWHDGQCSGGSTIPPYPSGDVLGSDAGRYWFYVVPTRSPHLAVDSPAPGRLSHAGGVAPIAITGTVPAGLTGGATVDYTISMPGFILEQGQVTPAGDTYHITFDPVALHADFPNLDLEGRDAWLPGLADTFSIGLLLRGYGAGPDGITYMANTLTIQGDQVFVGDARLPHELYLPLVLKGG